MLLVGVSGSASDQEKGNDVLIGETVRRLGVCVKGTVLVGVLLNACGRVCSSRHDRDGSIGECGFVCFSFLLLFAAVSSQQLANPND